MLSFKPCESFLLLPPKINSTNSKPHLLHLHHHHVKLHFPPLKAHSKSTLSSPPQLKPHSSSFTSDFLMDSGGLSSVQAFHVIQQYPNLLKDKGRKPRLVISYFESIGFSKTHISKIISKYPRLMLANVNKTLKPKIQVFQDFGFSESDIAYLIASNPAILRISLKDQIKPALDLIKRLIKTDEDLIKSIKRHNKYLVFNKSRKSIELNIEILRQYGVPDSEIMHMIVSDLLTLMSTPKAFKRNLESIVSLGFKPETRIFSIAVGVMCKMKEATWNSKMELLKGLGWSQVQILDIFRRQPKLLTLSCENFKEGIEFFKESLNWDALFLSRQPTILAFSMKTRVVPRYEVLKCLMSKEIIKEEDNKIFISMVRATESVFLSKYVFKYQDQLPYLYEIYKNQIKLGGCEEENGDIDMLV